jgi:hypothetical protein
MSIGALVVWPLMRRIAGNMTSLIGLNIENRNINEHMFSCCVVLSRVLSYAGTVTKIYPRSWGSAATSIRWKCARDLQC